MEFMHDEWFLCTIIILSFCQMINLYDQSRIYSVLVSY